MKKIFFIAIIILTSGCSKFLSDYSQDLVAAKSVNDLEEVLLGSGYVRSISFRGTGGTSINSQEMAHFLNFMDDDLNRTIGEEDNSSDYSFQSVIYGYSTWQSSVTVVPTSPDKIADNKTWNNVYKHINIYNIILNSLTEIDIESEADKALAETVRGEAYFLRAQLYLLLVNLYGEAYNPTTASTKLGVPLKLTHYVQYDKDQVSPFFRATLKEVYNQIVSDLNNSIAAFEISPQTEDFKRASGPAAKLLLSRVYLYMQDWENAKKLAEEYLTINNTLTNLSNIVDDSIQATKKFLNRDNVEIVFSQGSLTYQAGPISARNGAFHVTNDLLSIYPDGDGRKASFFTIPKPQLIDSTNLDLGYAPIVDSVSMDRKFKTVPEMSYVSDIFLLRTAEAYLNFAEAAAILGQDDVARQKLNAMLSKRGSFVVDGSYNGETLVNFIRDERRRELCFEGHRWFDLRRYAVNTKYPYSKTITRVFPVYSDAGAREFLRGLVFKLLPGDNAYTLQIPEAVLEKDLLVPNAVRPVRGPSSIFLLNKN